MFPVRGLRALGEEVVEVVEDGAKGTGGAQVDRPALVVLDGAVVPSNGAEVVIGGGVAEDVEGFAAVFDDLDLLFKLTARTLTTRTSR